MNGKNPYYTEQQVPPVDPYVNQQPYFSNQQQYSVSQPNYPPYRNANAHTGQQMVPNVVMVGVPQNHPPPNLTPCRFCRQPTGTYAQLRSGIFVWIMCFIIMLLTCCCWWIAFWIDDWKDVIFRCDKCRNIKAIKEGGC